MELGRILPAGFTAVEIEAIVCEPSAVFAEPGFPRLKRSGHRPDFSNPWSKSLSLSFSLGYASEKLEITYESFRTRGNDDSLSTHEKVGFPDEYREGYEAFIFDDIKRKLSRLNRRHQTVVDLGPGCGGPALMMIDHCRRHGHRHSADDLATPRQFFDQRRVPRALFVAFQGGGLCQRL